MSDLDALAQLQWVRAVTASGEARRLRLAARLTQAELAAAVGVAAPTIALWELGRRKPTGAAARRYAAALQRLASPRRSGARS